MDVGVFVMVAVFGVLLLYLMFFWVPVLLYTEAECLRNGYPKAQVSVGLERYCTNLIGTVTVKVEKAGKNGH